MRFLSTLIAIFCTALVIQAAVSSCDTDAAEGYDIVVAADGTGDFTTIQAAIDAVPAFRKTNRTTILVRKGTYKEKVIVAPCKINITLVGEEGAVIAYDDFAQRLNRFGEETTTSGSATIYLYAPDFYAENITFQNTAGPVGQAVACFVSGDRCCFRNCRFLGFQDTLYTFGEDCRIYFDRCYVEGTVDFIFGKSTAVFDHCEIHSLQNGFLTAPSTPQGQKYGYVFYDCSMTADEGVTEVYLSRPWRPYAKAVFVRCELGKHIAPVGWDAWDKEHPEETVLYAEYQSMGPGANPLGRAYFSRQLDNLAGYDMLQILAGRDGWMPAGTEAPLLVSVQ
ncbi:MAG: hypothetical protein IKX59_03325 [Bacteroidales bacterium]|nr:hypothetical protein [Bacteroidales bacterium]